MDTGAEGRDLGGLPGSLEVMADGVGLGDRGDDAHLAATVGTDLGLNLEQGCNHAKQNGRSPWSCRITALSTGRSLAKIPSQDTSQKSAP